MREWTRHCIAVARQLTRSACIAVPLSLALFSCGSPVRIVQIDSKPQGAIVYLDGVERGPTPQTLELSYAGDPRERHFIQLRLPGYHPMYQTWLFNEVPKTKLFPLQGE